MSNFKIFFLKIFSFFFYFFFFVFFSFPSYIDWIFVWNFFNVQHECTSLSLSLSHCVTFCSESKCVNLLMKLDCQKSLGKSF
ncbi:uncharacterized protein Smp_203340 [Schistosoma mansoni]|uniref:uncharacterized protein n=1 Tax=Schistosoma mansoni TaxID=6183 RepID=UPI00022DC255|nr:uncharacterized protein Smp_203340 [Schistosoma mansoni]|eukprot:XP_018653715.1 uncharacterized protein Smp_203340 [Schistosoma mansoni]